MSLIECEQLSKVYEMGADRVCALDTVDLKIEEGDFLAILGPSGSGKSTLMHLIGFLDRPSSGRILFDGQDFSKTTEAQRAAVRSERIGFVFQAFNLLPRLNLLQNTMLPLSYRRNHKVTSRKQAMDALDLVGLSDRIRHRPSELSGGQRQRAAIARALVNEPRLILADEPTGNLDSKTSKTLLEAFKELNRSGRTLVLVTHDSNVAAKASRTIEVLDGKIFEGPAA